MEKAAEGRPPRQAPPELDTSRAIPWKERLPSPSGEELSWGKMFQVSVEETFSAGHALRGYKGKCENVHGHNYRVRVTLEGPQLDSTGLLVDFTHLKHVIREIMGRLDHQFMNDLEPFKNVNPSAENVAKYFYEEATRRLKDLPPGARITDVILWETDTSRAQYRPGA
jgi:6-pyruvoyltetrahydropterin/6-carboxytetrahydropterin synthase